MLTSIQVQDSVSAGWTDLKDEWQVLAFRCDERGRYLTVRSYGSAGSAIRAAQSQRATENPAADLAVYCASCNERCSYLFGYVCPLCYVRPAGQDGTEAA